MRTERDIAGRENCGMDPGNRDGQGVFRTGGDLRVTGEEDFCSHRGNWCGNPTPYRPASLPVVVSE